MTAVNSLAAADDALRVIRSGHPTITTNVPGPQISVAIIVPTYADSGFLLDALRSVQQQTFTNWRCYVIDDASPENVDAVLEEFRSDSRFVLLRHGANAGLAAARNTGLRVCVEDAIQFLDADDLLTPRSLELRVADLRQHWNDPLAAGVHGQILQCTEETELADIGSWTTKTPLSKRDWLSAEGESPFTVHAPLTKASVVKSLGGFDETFLNGAEDWDFWHRVLRHGFVFPPTKAVVGAYRQRRASMIREHGSIHLGRAEALLEAAERWAHVDDSIAVSNARMPFSESKIAYQRLIRAARWAGIRAAQLKSVDEAIDDDILGFLRPEATVGTRRDDCFRAAKEGLIRGLGLSTLVVKDLAHNSRAVIEQAAWDISDRLLNHCASASANSTPTAAADLLLDRRRHADVALLAETNADASELISLSHRLIDAGLSVVAINANYALGDSGATGVLSKHFDELVPFNQVALGSIICDLVVTRSPVSPATLDLIDRVAQIGTRSVLLAGVDRELLLEDSPAFGAALSTANSDQIVEMAASKKPPTAAPTRRPTRPDFALLLPAEEQPLDAAGHEWMKKMKNNNQGKTVVVIGNGPSLNTTDLDLLRGTNTFGVNSVFLAEDRLPEALTYYVVEDSAVFKDNTEAIKAYPAVHKLFPTMYLPQFTNNEITQNTHFFRMNLGFYGRTAADGTSTGTLCHPRFSTDAAQRVYCGQSVTIINLQLAYWFGYSRVVLIGMDFSYQIPADAKRIGDIIVSGSDDPNHFHPDYFGAGKTWKDPKLERVMVNYRLAGEIFAADGREIINSTVGGDLNLFPRMPLAEALNA